MNRQYKLPKYTWFLFLSILINPGTLLSQNDAFYFEFFGPDTIFVGDNCMGVLEWGYPSNPDFECLSDLCVTTDTTLLISGGYQIGDSIPVGTTLTIDLLVIDNQGNNLDTFFTIFFDDNTAPWFDSLSLPPPTLSFSCIDDLPPAPSSEGFLAFDNCSALGDSLSPILISYDSIYSFTDSCSGGSLQRIWTATDLFGNSTSYSQWLIVEPDTFPPFFTTLPSSDTSACQSEDFAGWLQQQRSQIAASDNECGLLDISDDAPDTLSFSCGSQLVTFIATDRCGNTSSSQVSYTLIDSLKPQISPPTDTLIVLSCSTSPAQLDSIIDSWPAQLSVTDNCGAISWSNTYNGLSGGCSEETGSSSVFFIADDGCGNADSTRINFSLTDTVPPLFDIAPQDLSIACDTTTLISEIETWLSSFGNASISDNCSQTDSLSTLVLLNNTAASAETIVDSLLNIETCNPSINLTFLIADPCGNERLDSARIQLTDTIAPIWITPPTDLLIPCSQASIADSLINEWLNSNGNGFVQERCGGLIIQNNYSGLVPGCGATSSATVIFTAADHCSNLSSQSAVIKIFDTNPPLVLSPPIDTVVECDGSQLALNNWIDLKANTIIDDICDTAVWNYFINTLPSASTDTIFFGDYPNYPQVPDSTCDWSLDLSFVFSDSCGNNAQINAQFSIQDKTSPVLSGLPDTLFASCESIPSVGSPMLSDNCDPAPLLLFEETQIPGSCPQSYAIKRMWTATDYCGNTDSLLQWVIVEDSTPPLLQGIPADTEVSCDSIPPPPAIGSVISASDNCDGTLTIQFVENNFQDPDPLVCGHYTYLIERTWSVSDDCGNMTTSTQNLFIKDLVPPVFLVPNDITISCTDVLDTGLTGLPQNLEDNCDEQPLSSFTDDIQAGSCPQNYQILRTWIVTDACGNSSTQLQNITVEDNQAPQLIQVASNLSVSCSPDTELEDQFLDWINENGGAVALDNCGSPNWFAAVPGSYELDDPGTFPGTPSGTLAPPNCLAPEDGIYRKETVDFVVYDECFNAVVTQATFTVLDNSPPVLESCPEDMTISTSGNSCDTLFPLPLPQFSDNCNADLLLIGPSMPGLSVTQNITSSVPGDFQTPVEAVSITLGPVPGLPAYASAPASLLIELDQVDGEGDTEFFFIYGEDGSLLGTTQPTDSQCGSSSTTLSIPPALINSWAADQFIQISLEPNLPVGQSGAFAINDLCPAGPPTGGGGTATAVLTYEAYQPNDLRLAYQINSGDTLDFSIQNSPSELLGTGLHTLTYILTDCAGNATNCSFSILVEDLVPPQLVCPPDTTLSLTEDLDCSTGAPLRLPFPVSVTDNCSFDDLFSQEQPAVPEDGLLTFSYDPNYLDFVADDKSFTFSNIPADAAGDGVQLKVTTLGDVDNPGEYFRVWGEDNFLLGTNEVGQAHVSITAGSCSPMPVPSINEAIFIIPTQLFNNWASDGQVDISLESNKSFNQPPPGIFGDGISPFCTFFPSDTLDGISDGLSSVFLELSYQQTEVTYFSTGATSIPPSSFPAGPPPEHTFSQGITSVFYTISDESGNSDTCSFEVLVLDTLPPTALCQPITIFVNPSGVDDYTLTPQEVDAGSFDNCGIADMQLSQEVISCEQAGSTLSITLTVLDESGNSGSCNALVNVKTLAPEPSFTGGFCENDTLQLFTNPPSTSAPNDDFYTYVWTGPPSGLTISNEEDPVISPIGPGNSGPYTVTISGVTGCTASATINVVIEPQPPTPLLISQAYFCLGEEAILSTQSYNGGSTWYLWYEQQGSDLILLDSTQTASLTLPAFSNTGTYQYTVMVKVDGCPSNLSTPVPVEVLNVPLAELANAPVIEECAGANIELSAADPDPTLTYTWSGPDGFQFTGPNPPVLMNVDSFQSGTYLLTVSNPACAADPLETILLINPTPSAPNIFGQSQVCEGDPIELSTTPSQVDSYTWISPFMTTAITSEPFFEVPAADSSHDGSWTVFSVLDGCPSQAAVGFPVSVAPLPEVEATYAQPACENVELELSANFFPDADYEWAGPMGYQGFTQTPSAPPISGLYQVTVTTLEGCTAQVSFDVTISEAPVITAISNTGDDCVDGSSDIQLIATLFPPDDGNYEYAWTGPGNYASSSAVGIIPNATADDIGPYNLVITNGAGCTSETETTVVDVTDTPPPPELIPAGQLTFCEGDPVTFSALGGYSGQVSYVWNTPLGSFTSTSSSYTIDALAPINSGGYSLTVIQNGCTSALSNLANITVNPKPGQPSAQVSPSPVCEGDTLQLQTKFFSNASYQWIGPAGFDATTHNPVIYPVNPIHEGNYAVQVIINGCASDYSSFVFADVNPRPQIPQLSSNSPVCLDDPEAELLLYVINGAPGNNLSYSWFELPSEDLIAGPSTSDSLLLNDLSSFQPGTKSFFAIAQNTAGCLSLPSLPVEVKLDEPLSILPFAGDDQFLCEAQSTVLNAEDPEPATGFWTQAGGPSVSITNPSNPNSAVNGLQQDQIYAFQWSLSNGACTNFAADTVFIQIDDNNQQAQVISNIQLCDSTQVLLEAVAAEAGNLGIWTQPLDQINAGIEIVNPESNITYATGLSEGEYSFTWTLSNEGCGAFSSAQVNVSVGVSEGEEALAGADQLLCGSDQVLLSAQELQSNEGMWSTTSPDVEIIFPEMAESQAMGLQAGENLFIWEIRNPNCGIIDADTIRIVYDPGPLALDDTLSTLFGTPVEIFPVENDSVLFSGFEFGLLNMPENGRLEIDSDSSVTYIPNIPFTGEDLFIYEICSELCPDLCDQARVRIRVIAETNCVIPTIFTPNGDGVNDAFIIPCLEGGRYPANQVSIFNEWGDEVFRAAPYQNKWEGTFNGNPLAVGTYFYLVDFGDGSAPQSGFLILER
jgi:gliding motility-associated-like protein